MSLFPLATVCSHSISRSIIKLAFNALLLAIVLASPPCLAQESMPIVDPQNPLIEKLAKAISNTKWTGSFTLTGKEENPKTESYEIKEAQYQGDDKWLLTARIAYGDRDVTVPIPLEIKWAGRTPVITVDNLTIPSMGTFDARVLMRRGSYAGTWAHGDKGGHLFGKYEKLELSEPSTDAQPSPSTPEN